MLRTHHPFSFTLAAGVALLTLLTLAAHAATVKVLHSFSGNADGATPVGGLIFDSSGNLYGTTSDGGKFGFGTVFELTRSNGRWHEILLHSFAGYPTDGATPLGSLVFDKSGNLYGTTSSGGLSNGLSGGTVFKLSPSSGGWNESILYNFVCCSGDAFGPVSAVFLHPDGNIYGTTLWGGTGTNCFGFNPGCGAFFRLTPSSGGSWKETVLHSFGGPPDAAWPQGSLVLDPSGTFYGTSSAGGIESCSNGCGTVFQLSPTAGGGWSSTVLYQACSDSVCNGGDALYGSLVFDTAGNLYGTAGGGGPLQGQGTVLKMTPSSKGWTESVLVTFRGGNDGSSPRSGVVMDASGNLYGTTYAGGGLGCLGNGCGVVFELEKSALSWQGKILYRFGNGGSGSNPLGGIILDESGNVYGTTTTGGSSGFGTVFELTP